MPCPQCGPPNPAHEWKSTSCRRRTLYNCSRACRCPQLLACMTHPLCTEHCFGVGLLSFFFFFPQIYMFSLSKQLTSSNLMPPRPPDSTQQNTLYEAGPQQTSGWGGLNVPAGLKAGRHGVFQRPLCQCPTRGVATTKNQSPPFPQGWAGVTDSSSFQTSICAERDKVAVLANMHRLK